MANNGEKVIDLEAVRRDRAFRVEMDEFRRRLEGAIICSDIPGSWTVSFRDAHDFVKHSFIAGFEFCSGHTYSLAINSEQLWKSRDWEGLLRVLLFEVRFAAEAIQRGLK